MDGLRSLLENQQILTLFLVISLGYAVGEVAIASFCLGVGAVLFVGLFVGSFAPQSAPHVLLSTVGLVLFCYGIKIQYGKAFIEGLSSRAAKVVIKGIKSEKIGYLGIDVYEQEEELFFRNLSDMIVWNDMFQLLRSFRNVLSQPIRLILRRIHTMVLPERLSSVLVTLSEAISSKTRFNPQRK